MSEQTAMEQIQGRPIKMMILWFKYKGYIRRCRRKLAPPRTFEQWLEWRK